MVLSLSLCNSINSIQIWDVVFAVALFVFRLVTVGLVVLLTSNVVQLFQFSHEVPDDVSMSFVSGVLLSLVICCVKGPKKDVVMSSLFALNLMITIAI